MNTRQLDPFQTALLAELRTHVAERASHQEAPEVPGRGPARRWAAGLSVAAAGAAAFVVVGLGGTDAPAYAVDRTSDGSVVVTIHRLEDAAGLEAELAEHGVDAEVSYAGSGVEGVEIGDGTTEVTSTALPPADCALGDAPSTLGRDGSDWVLTIPAGSPLLEQPVALATDDRGVLAATYPGTDGGTCSVIALP